MRSDQYRYSLRRLFRNIKAVRRAALPPDLERQIITTCFSTLFLARYGGTSKRANVCGLTIRYCSVESFLYLFHEIFIAQSYRFVTPNRAPYIIDCGANIGMASVYFKTLFPGAEVLAFEPDPEPFALLVENISENRFKGIVARNEALLQTEGAVDFFYSPESSGSLCSSTTPGRLPGPSKQVKAVRLSPFIDRMVDFLKMDIEGAEAQVLAELSNSGKLPLVGQMVIEYHHHIDECRDALSEVLLTLERAGFGYQLEASLRRPFASKQFQDVVIYAYNKNGPRG